MIAQSQNKVMLDSQSLLLNSENLLLRTIHPLTNYNLVAGNDAQDLLKVQQK